MFAAGEGPYAVRSKVRRRARSGRAGRQQDADAGKARQRQHQAGKAAPPARTHSISLTLTPSRSLHLITPHCPCTHSFALSLALSRLPLHHATTASTRATPLAPAHAPSSSIRKQPCRHSRPGRHSRASRMASRRAWAAQRAYLELTGEGAWWSLELRAKKSGRDEARQGLRRCRPERGGCS
jgi:hypothetical protein